MTEADAAGNGGSDDEFSPASLVAGRLLFCQPWQFLLSVTTMTQLPDMRGVLAQFANVSDSCPQGLQYVRNPWLDRVIDAFRQVDQRWGYNAKPTRTAADNRGVPVEVAGARILVPEGFDEDLLARLVSVLRRC